MIVCPPGILTSTYHWTTLTGDLTFMDWTVPTLGVENVVLLAALAYISISLVDPVFSRKYTIQFFVLIENSVTPVIETVSLKILSAQNPVLYSNLSAALKV